MDIYKRLEELNIILPPVPPKGGLYSQLKKFGNNLYYVSGMGPEYGDNPYTGGKLGKEFTAEEGKEAARACMLNILALIHNELGDLNKIKKFVKILGFVASAENFYDQPKVLNGASEVLVSVFGEDVGLAARAAVGVFSLPDNIPVEIELIFEI